MGKHGKQYELGQYMTPPNVADDLCNLIQSDPSTWVVHDPACGEGALLLAIIRIMKKAGVKDISNRISGTDIDPVMVKISKENIATELDISTELVNVNLYDFLDQTNTPLYNNCPKTDIRPTIIVANPPYAKNKEYDFFDRCNTIYDIGTELYFIMPLACMDKLNGSIIVPLVGRPFGVTTGHCFVKHTVGKRYSYRSAKEHQSNSSLFKIHVGAKLYELGGGTPPQTIEIMNSKPYSSESYIENWIPCCRTGDIQQYKISETRLWVNYGEHLAHPKTIELFTGPRLFVRRVPIWKNKQLGSVYIDCKIMCAGDIIVIKHKNDDEELLKGLCVFLNSERAANIILENRPSLEHRMSYPKISSKDINKLIDDHIVEKQLYKLANQYPNQAGVKI